MQTTHRKMRRHGPAVNCSMLYVAVHAHVTTRVGRHGCGTAAAARCTQSRMETGARQQAGARLVVVVLEAVGAALDGLRDAVAGNVVGPARLALAAGHAGRAQPVFGAHLGVRCSHACVAQQPWPQPIMRPSCKIAGLGSIQIFLHDNSEHGCGYGCRYRLAAAQYVRCLPELQGFQC